MDLFDQSVDRLITDIPNWYGKSEEKNDEGMFGEEYDAFDQSVDKALGIQRKSPAKEFSFGRLGQQAARGAGQGFADIGRYLQAVEERKDVLKDMPYMEETGIDLTMTPVERGEFGERLSGIARMEGLQGGIPQERMNEELRRFKLRKHAETIKGYKEYADQFPEMLEGSSGIIEDAVGGMARFLPSMAVSAANPLAGTAMTFAQITGMKYDQYIKQGIDKEKAFQAATISALFQTPLEMAGNLLQIGALKNIAYSLLKKSGKTGLQKTGVFIESFIKAVAGEGIEEFLQQYPDEIADIIVARDDLSPQELAKKVLEELPAITERGAEAMKVGAVGGGLLSMLGGGGMILADSSARIAKYLSEKEEAKAEKGEKEPELTPERLKELYEAGEVSAADLISTKETLKDYPDSVAIIDEILAGKPEAEEKTQAQINQELIDQAFEEEVGEPVKEDDTTDRLNAIADKIEKGETEWSKEELQDQAIYTDELEKILQERKAAKEPEVKPAKGARPGEIRSIYKVQTEDIGETEVALTRHADGSVTIFTDKGPVDYKAEFTKDKSDSDLLKYLFEPQGYISSQERKAKAEPVKAPTRFEGELDEEQQRREIERLEKGPSKEEVEAQKEISLPQKEITEVVEKVEPSEIKEEKIPEKEITPPEKEISLTKEPWGMTWNNLTKRDDLFEILAEDYIKTGTNPRLKQDLKSWIDNKKPLNEFPAGLEVSSRSHRSIVKKAVEEGKPVPKEVLAEYPELQAEKKGTWREEPLAHGKVSYAKGKYPDKHIVLDYTDRRPELKGYYVYKTIKDKDFHDGYLGAFETLEEAKRFADDIIEGKTQVEFKKEPTAEDIKTTPTKNGVYQMHPAAGTQFKYENGKWYRWDGSSKWILHKHKKGHPSAQELTEKLDRDGLVNVNPPESIAIKPTPKKVEKKISLPQKEITEAVEKVEPVEIKEEKIPEKEIIPPEKEISLTKEPWKGILYRGSNVTGGRGKSYTISEDYAKSYGKNIRQNKLKPGSKVLVLAEYDEGLKGWTDNEKMDEHRTEGDFAPTYANFDSKKEEELLNKGYDAVVFADEGELEIRILNKESIEKPTEAVIKEEVAEKPKAEEKPEIEFTGWMEGYKELPSYPQFTFTKGEIETTISPEQMERDYGVKPEDLPKYPTLEEWKAEEKKKFDMVLEKIEAKEPLTDEEAIIKNRRYAELEAELEKRKTEKAPTPLQKAAQDEYEQRTGMDIFRSDTMIDKISEKLGLSSFESASLLKGLREEKIDENDIKLLYEKIPTFDEYVKIFGAMTKGEGAIDFLKRRYESSIGRIKEKKPYDKFKGVMVKVKGIDEDMNVYEVEEDAAIALKDIDSKIETLNKLVECVK